MTFPTNEPFATDARQWDPELAAQALNASVSTIEEVIEIAGRPFVQKGLTTLAKAFAMFMTTAREIGANDDEIIWQWRKHLANRYDFGEDGMALWCLLEEGSRFMGSIPSPIRDMVLQAYGEGGLSVHMPDGAHRSMGQR